MKKIIPISKELEFRALTPNDAEALRSLRLDALSSVDGKNFETDINEEKSRTINDWRTICTEKNTKAVLGAFRNGKLIGTMSVRNYTKDPTGNTAYCHSAFVLPEYRGGHVTSQLASLRDKWAKEHGYKKVASGIKFDNLKWLERQIKLGGKITSHSRATYADGKQAIFYIIERNIEPVRHELIPTVGLIPLSA